MDAETIAKLQAQLDEMPGDWRIIVKVEQVPLNVSPGGTYERSSYFVESHSRNLVLEGPWPWILRRVISYATSPKL